MYLMDLDEHETKRAVTAAQGILTMLQRSPPPGKLDEYKLALMALQEAIGETTRYQRRTVSENGSRNEETEKYLSDAWFDVANKIGEFNPQLGNRCRVKGWGWADEKTWHLPKYQKLLISLHQMIWQFNNAMQGVQTHEAAEREFRRLVDGFKSTAAARVMRSPWVSGSLKLAVVLCAIVIAGWLAKAVAWYLVVPIIIAIASILIVTVVGALHLRPDEKLSQQTFLELMGLAFRQLPLVGIISRRAREPEQREGIIGDEGDDRG
jgi:hypothetical protein